MSDFRHCRPSLVDALYVVIGRLSDHILRRLESRAPLDQLVYGLSD